MVTLRRPEPLSAAKASNELDHSHSGREGLVLRMSQLRSTRLCARIQRVSLCVAASMVLAGCVSTKTVELPLERLSKWRGKKKGLTTRPKGGFAFMAGRQGALAFLRRAGQGFPGKSNFSGKRI